MNAQINGKQKEIGQKKKARSQFFSSLEGLDLTICPF